MAQGFLGSADLTATVVALLFTAGVTPQTFNIRLCNRNATPITVRVAIGTGGAPANTDWIDYDLPVPANGTFDDTGLVASSGEKIWVESNASNVSARAHGL